MKYGFIPPPTKQLLPICLICQKVFLNVAMKPSRLEKCLTKTHAGRKDKNLCYYQILEKNIFGSQMNQTFFLSSIKQDDVEFYDAALLTAKARKLHTIRVESILMAVMN